MKRALLPALVLLTLACSGGGFSGQPASAPTLAPVAAEVAPAAATAKPHCVEATHFSCAVAGGKEVAICEEEGSLVYRFGPRGAVEKEYPGFGEALTWRYEEPTTVSASGNSLSFDGKTHSFQVVEMAGAGGANAEANNFAGVVVTKGDDVVSTISCVGPVVSDWARIAEVMAQ